MGRGGRMNTQHTAKQFQEWWKRQIRNSRKNGERGERRERGGRADSPQRSETRRMERGGRCDRGSPHTVSSELRRARQVQEACAAAPGFETLERGARRSGTSGGRRVDLSLLRRMLLWVWVWVRGWRRGGVSMRVRRDQHEGMSDAVVVLSVSLPPRSVCRTIAAPRAGDVSHGEKRRGGGCKSLSFRSSRARARGGS